MKTYLTFYLLLFSIVSTGYGQAVNLVQNSNFSMGNTAFTSSYVFSNDLVPEGRYSIVSEANSVHYNFQQKDHTNPPTGLFMAVNGAGNPNLNVWCQTVAVTPNTDYSFSTWVCSLSDVSPARLQFSINGVQLKIPFTAPATTNRWIQFFEIWNSGNSTSANICIVNQNTIPLGNDFGLDDITFIVSCSKPSVTIPTNRICAGSSVQLSATGGSKYAWSPELGLDNPKISNPIASPDTTTKYKVIATNGVCVDSEFVTIIVYPLPTADAGNDTAKCSNATVEIGTSPIGGTSYSWRPTKGLSNPNASRTKASPDTTTTYILKATNSRGCSAEDTVTVTSINSTYKYQFTLTPDVVTITPGTPFQTSLHIPNYVHSWNFWIDYNPRIVGFDSIVQTTNGITVFPPQEKNGRLFLSGSGDSGLVVIQFQAFVPYNLDSTFSMNLIVDSSQLLPCENIVTKGNTLELDQFCARMLRPVDVTNSSYFLAPKGNAINFGIGLSGKVRLEVYDYIGILNKVLVDDELSAGEYSLDFEMPTGVYFCRIRAGMFDEMKKVIVLPQ